MKRGEDSDSIPNDLVLEILSRLPAKSTGRFRCVSKLWGSMLHKLYFSELFLTRSAARPRLLIGIYIYGELVFFSLPQPQIPYENSSSIVVGADFHMKLGRATGDEGCHYASGLILCLTPCLTRLRKPAKRVIYNPITRQHAILPKVGLKYRSSIDMLGYDLIGKQFKVLSMDYRFNENVHYILTLGTGNVRWRKIQCPFTHHVRGEGIYISGVLYYLADEYIVDKRRYVIGCFDVRSEKFTSLLLNSFCSYEGSNTLINYKGKLGVVNLRYEDDDGGFPIHLRVCVLEDFEKQEWSTSVFTLMPDDDEVFRVKDFYVYVAGMTSTGELVLVKRHAYKPFYVFYFNLERNTLLSVEIQGVGEDRVGEDRRDKYHRVWAFVDHVENLQFNIMKKPSISPPKQKRKTTGTSTPSKKYRHVSTSTSSR